jgi:methylenetetrahydrofolate--tRNA-(uracil-5-)-methyltransferase
LGSLILAVANETHLPQATLSVQLRQEKEQECLFHLISGLEQAVFLRFGSLHRNTFIHAPALLQRTLQLKKDERFFFAGQITPVEDYVESAAMGLRPAINAARHLEGKPMVSPPQTTAIGGLIHYLSNPPVKKFQPTNVNFGLFPSLDRYLRGKEKHKAWAERALRDLKEWANGIGTQILADKHG